MRICKVCAMVAVLGLLLMLSSCSGGEVTKNDTETFLAGLSTMFAEAAMDESSQVINDFMATEPPGPELPELMSFTGMSLASAEKLRNPDPYGLDTLYGTWGYYPAQGWVLISPNNPANAVLFEWEYLDTAYVEHDVYMRLDSLNFYQDSLPTKLWAGVGMDGSLLAWLKLEAGYLSLDEVNEVSLVYEVVNQLQVGISLSSATAIDTIFVGTVSLWAINLTNDYRVDLDITVDEDFPEEIVLSDSEGWRMEVNFSDVVETDSDEYDEYERRNVSGEITSDGNHAADISGYVWEPDDGDEHSSEIVITFSDDTEGDLADYIPIVP
ncbi:hypothetical protein JW879_03675 [candidate division WOR-3 bacterium]|nr:hypothetical protein [candidate division WOR-3 bacterium]